VAWAPPSRTRSDRSTRGRTALREELVESGELVRVTVEGVRGPRFVLRDEVGLLSAPPERAASVAFLPLMDPLMWDRSLLQPLFDFDWVWEVFTPEHKRRWGYYVLPILFRDRLVGRDRAADRPRRRPRARARALVGGRLQA
jgi:uncharacterized protein YcaQ